MKGKIKAGILGLILLVGSITAIVTQRMELYMGLFFIIFSSFKLFDIKGFADGFVMYDLLAKRSKLYALVYPFVEMTLGIFFVFGLFSQVALLLTIGVMSIGALGVFKALLKKQDFTCACLGTTLGIPLTYVTLFENIIMVVMALILLI